MLEGPALLPKEEVQGGQWWAKSANSRLVWLCAAEQVALQGSVGSDSQAAAEIAHSALASEGKQESLLQLSPPLQGTEFVLNILLQSEIRSSILPSPEGWPSYI